MFATDVPFATGLFNLRSRETRRAQSIISGGRRSNGGKVAFRTTSPARARAFHLSGLSSVINRARRVLCVDTRARARLALDYARVIWAAFSSRRDGRRERATAPASPVPTLITEERAEKPTNVVRSLCCRLMGEVVFPARRDAARRRVAAPREPSGTNATRPRVALRRAATGTDARDPALLSSPLLAAFTLLPVCLCMTPGRYSHMPRRDNAAGKRKARFARFPRPPRESGS